jgi:tetratricopeptide (TPR) repeat protein
MYPVGRIFLLLFALTVLRGQAPVSCETGLALYKAGEFAKAQDFIWSCIESGHGKEEHGLSLAQTYRSLKNYELGLGRVHAALQKLPDNVELLYIAGYLRYRRNETKDSMILATTAYRLAPNDWRIHQLFALNYISFNMLETAKLSLGRAISLNPNNAELYYQLSRLHFALGSFVDAVENSKKALAIFPDYPEVYHNLALCYEGSGNVSLAIQNFEKAIELNRKYHRQDEWPLIDYAVYQRMGGKPEAGILLLNEALKINPSSSKANYEMGELLRDMRRYAEARRYLEIAVNLDPCNARAIYGLAILTRQLGEVTRAAALLKRFKEVDRATKESTNSGSACHAAAVPQ